MSYTIRRAGFPGIIVMGALLAAPMPAITVLGQSPINLRRTIVVEVVEKTKGAVVNISTTKLISRRTSPFGNDPFWQPFDLGPVQRVPANSLGSGFIIHREGYVVTNNHVIDHARVITVELDDGRKLPAELVSSDADADVAVLKISSDQPLPTLELGDSSDLMIGEPAIAIGNPLGFSHTVSTGIVSATHRDLKDSENKVMLPDLIQTDAAINPGNSGGPLLNAYGQVIGINTAIRSDAQNIGFSIPVNKLRDLIPELMNPAQVTKTEVGLKLTEKRELSPPCRIVCQIMGRNRVVTAINGQSPANIVDAYALLLKGKANAPLTITYAGGQAEQIIGKAVPLPDAIVQARERLGLVVVAVTPMLAEKYHLESEDGLMVTEVIHNSVAARAGLQPGDVITQLGRYRVANLDDFSALLHRLPESGKVRVGIVRGDQAGYGVLDL